MRRSHHARHLVADPRPELAVIDIRMPPKHGTEGLDAAKYIRENFPTTALLLLSAYIEVEQAMDLLAAGRGSGYLMKSRLTDVDQFLDTVDRVLKSGSVVDPALVVRESSPHGAPMTPWTSSPSASAKCWR